jgi:hypothetical protein
MTLPALRRLRESFQGARISLVDDSDERRNLRRFAFCRTTGLCTTAASRDAWGDMDGAKTACMEFQSRSTLSKRFSRQRCFAYASKASVRVGFAGEGRSFLLTNALLGRREHPEGTRSLDYLDLVAEAESASTLALHQTQMEEDSDAVSCLD